MAKIDLEKLFCDILKYSQRHGDYIQISDIEMALKEQGLEYKDGKIVEIKRERPKPISAIDLEKRITSVEEKLCELQDRLEQNAHEY